MLQGWLNNKVDFDILFRGKRDGFTSAKFHELCNGKGPTLTIVKSDKGKVFGGFTARSWASIGSYAGDSEAFIFSLTHRTKHNQVQNPEKAVYDSVSNMLGFGDNHDFVITSECNTKPCTSKLG
jgi:hypothetical protein